MDRSERERFEVTTAAREAALMSEIAEGKEAAFVLLYRLRRNDVFRFVVALAGSTSLADDVTQEVFLSVLQNASRYDAAKGSARAWLLGTARNLALGRLRHESRWTEESAVEPGVACPGEDLVFKDQQLACLHLQISRLPARFRDAIVLCELMELSYVEAANVMRCPIGTVRSRLYRAREMLARELQERDGSASRCRRLSSGPGTERA